MRSFTDALRRELIATRVRVMEVDPGQVETVCGFFFLLRVFDGGGGMGGLGRGGTLLMARFRSFRL